MSESNDQAPKRCPGNTWYRISCKRPNELNDEASSSQQTSESTSEYKPDYSIFKFGALDKDWSLLYPTDDTHSFVVENDLRYPSVDQYIWNWVRIEKEHYENLDDHFKEHLFTHLTAGYYAKCKASPATRKMLLSTGSRLIVFCRKDDEWYSCGLDKEDANTENPGKWCGKNMVGLALMHVRARIREEWKVENLDGKGQRKRQKKE